jgi:hypothetical protein
LRRTLFSVPHRQHARAASRGLTQEIAMFGWLAIRSPSLCHRAPRSVISRRVRRIAPHALIDMLPALGSVLYLHDSTTALRDAVLPGVLVAQAAFGPLLEAHWLAAVSIVTDDGPREWCECVDRLGRIRARWHLLPDTDYLAWDALTAPCAIDADAPPVTQAWRPDHACVVNFRLRAWAGMLLLEQDHATPLSPLGDRIVARIAHAEAVALAPS